MGKFKNIVPALKCRRTNGKFALLLFISMFSIHYSYSQNVVTNSNGEKIILNTDGTWYKITEQNPKVVANIEKSELVLPGVVGCNGEKSEPLFVSKIIEIDKFPYIVTNKKTIFMMQKNPLFKIYPIQGITIAKNETDIKIINDYEKKLLKNEIKNEINISCSDVLPSSYSNLEWSFEIDYVLYKIYYSVDKNNDVFTFVYTQNGVFQLKKVCKVIDWSK